jgi:hypothetical protein
VTLGVVAGFCSAYAMRAIGRTLAIAVGVVFLGLQGLQHAGYITINWGKAEQKMVATFDQDGDGKLTKDDLGRRRKIAFCPSSPRVCRARADLWLDLSLH